MSPGGPGVFAARLVLVALPLAAAAAALALPDSILFGGACWLVALAASLAGWGRAVARLARVEGDLGLRLAWGAAAYLALGGWLMAAGVLSAPVQLALIAAGLAAHAGFTLTGAPPLDPRQAWRALAARPALAVYGVIAAVAIVNALGAIARARANIYDDDVAYTALVQRLMQIGDLDEPFSFRRISAYGGQTLLSSLGAVRGTLSNLYLVDHGLFRLIALALVVGLARTRRTPARPIDHALFVTLLLVLVTLPDTSINTTSHWAGAALFLALYRTACLDESPGRWVLVGLVAAAAASLRQNHVVVAGGFVAVHLLMTSAQPGALRRWGAAAVGAAAGLLPYVIASWRTFGTPLYPIIPGNANPDVSLTPLGMTWWQELQFFVRVLIEPTPIRVMLPMALVLFAAGDRRPGRPLLALAVAATAGFALLVHGFTLSDPPNLWRYAFGFMIAWMAVVVIDPAPGVTLPAFGRLLAFAALLGQLMLSSISMARSYASLGTDLGAAVRGHNPELAAAPRDTYRALQDAAPGGSRLAVLLDRPFLLDYRRHDIVNLDTPGYVGPDGGTPAFDGAEAVAAYLQRHGMRHVAFVRGERSRYFYRRDFWVLRTFFDSELWQVMGAYLIDFTDNLAELSRTRRVLFERDGLVLLDLATPGAAAPSTVAPPRTRAAFVRGLAEREGLVAAWQLTSRDDLLFDDGFSTIRCVDPLGLQRAYETGYDCLVHSGVPVRWMSPTTHLRVRAAEARRLTLRGRINLAEVFTRPDVTLALGGRVLWSAPVDASGRFEIAATFAGPTGGWADVYLTFSSVGEPWRDPARLTVLRLDGATWEPVTP